MFSVPHIQAWTRKGCLLSQPAHLVIPFNLPLTHAPLKLVRAFPMTLLAFGFEYGQVGSQFRNCLCCS